MAKEEKANVSFKLDKSIKKQVQLIAIEKETTSTELYTKWILAGIKNELNQTELEL